MPGAKDLSEICRNWIASVGIISGGLWAFFEWNTFLPRTEAEIQREIASVRTRTSGDIAVWLGGPPDGEEAATADGRYFAEVCDETGRAYVTLPVRIRLTLRSTSDLPVKVTVASFGLSELGGSEYSLHEGTPDAVFRADMVDTVAEVPLTPDAFLGGLNWSHVEPGGEAVLAVLGSASFPFDCSRGISSWVTSDFSIALRTELEPVLDGRSERAEPVDRYFVQVCSVQPAGTSRCGTGDASNGTSQDGAGTGDGNLKSIAQ